MKLKTALISIPLMALSILLTQSSIAYSCEEEDSTPDQSLKTIRDHQSGLVFEVASNYQTVANTTTEGEVWKEIYIMEPIAYCFLQEGESKALMGANYVLIQLFSGSSSDVIAFLDRFESSPGYYIEKSVNGNSALVGNDVVAINHPDGEYWAIIYDTTSENLDWASDFTEFSRNNQILLQQIYQSIQWSTRNSNQTGKQNATQNLALLEAIDNQDIEGVKAALAKGADANASNPAGISALMLAASNGNLDIFNTLLDAGADVNLESGEGETALMYAAANGHLEIAQILIEQGANVNVQDAGDFGGTALIRAVAGGHIGIVRLLLANGADVSIQTLYGDTAWTLAQEYGYLEIIELLEKAGS